MISANVAQPVTARMFLFGGEPIADAAGGFARSIGHHGVARSALGGLRRLSGSALQAVDCEVASVVAGLLDVGLGDALVSAWRKHTALTEAAERTLTLRDSEEVVVLATHRVGWTYRPHVDLVLDGRKLKTFHFDLTATFELHGVVAVVRRGDLVALRAGDCLITATLELEGQALARKQERMDVAFVVPLDPPVPLLGETASPHVGRRQRGALTS
jgi:hypothetical protein